jgi:eukaryotic-like serine/threonine-protein kinase
VFKFITHRPLWANILTGLVLTVIIFFIFIFSLKWCTHHNQSKTVPAVLGKSYDEAKDLLERAGFEVEIQDSIYTDTTKPLTVIKQVPEADELVKVNRTVYLTINRAVPPAVEMPYLVGYSYRSAEMALKNANLRVGDTLYKPDFAKDAVLEQRYQGNLITPGTKIPMGSSISLVLGDGVGNQQFVVPSLIGMTYTNAKAFLQSYGLSFGAVLAEGVADTANAYIYSQRPMRFDEEKKLQHIRPGQLMDIWLQVEKPVIDSLGTQVQPLPE